MPTIELSALTLVASLNGAERIPVLQGGSGKAATVDDVADYVNSTLDMSELYALAYNVDAAYPTYAAMVGSTPTAGKTAVAFADSNPSSNIKAIANGSSWVQDVKASQAKFVIERGTVNPYVSGNIDSVYHWKSTWNSGSNNAGVLYGLRVDISTNSLTNYDPSSRYIDIRTDNVSRFVYDTYGFLRLRTAAGTDHGGISVDVGGVVSLNSGDDPAAGLPAQMVQFYWQEAAHKGLSDASSVAVMRGQGGNRFSIESPSAITHIAENGRYEWESVATARMHFVGYEAASSLGKTIDFNNTGQTGTKATPVSVSTVDTTVAPFKVGFFNGTSTWTDYLRVLGTGQVFIANTTEPPTPTGGVVFWAEGGAWKAKGSSGTVTVVAPA